MIVLWWSQVKWQLIVRLSKLFGELSGTLALIVKTNGDFGMLELFFFFFFPEVNGAGLLIV